MMRFAAVLFALAIPLSAHAASMTAATTCPSEPRCPDATGWLFDYKVPMLDAKGKAEDGFTHVLVRPTTVIGQKRVACTKEEPQCRGAKRAKRGENKTKKAEASADFGFKLEPVYAKTQAEARAWADQQVAGKEPRWSKLRAGKKQP